VRVATWNINNVNRRLDLLLDWLARKRPDVVALQETKTTAALFPRRVLKEAGYESFLSGQKTWNGVALLSRSKPVPVLSALPGDPLDKEARYVEAAIDGVVFGCLYLPNGNPRPGPKFDYKLRWFERLRARARELWASSEPVVLLGDWNVVPTDADIYKVDSWRENALLQPEPRAAFADLIAQGWIDALKAAVPVNTPFTFWDYMRRRWERDAGLRIDHVLVSSALSVIDAGVDREERGRENPSDHAPVWVDLELRLKPSRKRAAAKSSVTVKPAAGAKKTGKPRDSSTQAAATPASLDRYNAKRDFSLTAEPVGVVPVQRAAAELRFVIQKHWASRLHYDFRLELDGVMISWAVPKGPSFDPASRQMAIRVEDHPMAYNAFEGEIPKGQYGAGTVIIWDQGTWAPVGDPREGLTQGKLIFEMHGQKLAGLWELVRISKPEQKTQEQWLLFKKRGDAWARSIAEYDVITALPDSVVKTPLGLVEQREPRVSTGRKISGEPDLTHAARAQFPEKLEPQLATLIADPPTGGDWVIENKFDGYRAMLKIEAGKLRILTRNGNDWTAKLKSLVDEVESLDIEQAWLDGEMVVLNDHGLPDFNRLQNAFDNGRTDDIVLYLFDVPFLGETDLRQVPLRSRRMVLKELLKANLSDRIRLSEELPDTPAAVLGAACRIGLEGVMLKAAGSPYVCGRSENWLKLKCQRRQEFVVVGFTNRANASKELGALLLGYHDELGHLRLAGSVGTGWSSAHGRELLAQVSALERKTPAVAPAQAKPGRWSSRAPGKVHWVRPEMVVEVAFGEWTPDGNVRHATFKGIRTDRAPQTIRREKASTPATEAVTTKPAAKRSAKPRTSVKLSNPDRVIDPSSGLRKVDLMHFYESVADRMLPHLRNRPVSLVRAPQGITGQLFFQKHSDARIQGITKLDAALWPGHEALLTINTVEGLISAAQWNVVEFHTWNSTSKRIDQPDRVIFDLDPGEGVTWAHVQEAALLMRTMLSELGLQCWLKTSGGKGLHVVVPLAAKLGYDVVKDFSRAVVMHMAKTIPQRFVAKSGGGNRVGKIFIDYLRNGHGQTTAAAFSARARPGMGVSMPVSWEQLASLKSGAQWTVTSAREYLSFEKVDPWADYRRSRQTLAKARKTLRLDN
jgi:bifunctional non-homologous end joining protein LigD